MTEDDIEQLALYIRGRPWPGRHDIFRAAGAGDFEQMALLRGLLTDDAETIRRGLRTLDEIEAMWRNHQGAD